MTPPFLPVVRLRPKARPRATRHGFARGCDNAPVTAGRSSALAGDFAAPGAPVRPGVRA